MPQFLVSVPYSLIVTVEADTADDITDDMVDEALVDQHGEYANVRIGDGGDFIVLDSQ